MKITVLGAGGWGTALARLLIQNGHQVTLWSWQQQQADEIGCFHENRSFLPGVLLPETLHVTCDMKEALSKTELVVFAVPSNASADVAAAAQPFIDSNVVLLNAAKGFAKERSPGGYISEDRICGQSFHMPCPLRSRHGSHGR